MRYELLTLNNIVTFLILYIIFSIIFYFSLNYDKSSILINKKNGGYDKEINHVILGKISEDLSIGFTPS
jgi:hypothetical protein